MLFIVYKGTYLEAYDEDLRNAALNYLDKNGATKIHVCTTFVHSKGHPFPIAEIEKRSRWRQGQSSRE